MFLFSLWLFRSAIHSKKTKGRPVYVSFTSFLSIFMATPKKKPSSKKKPSAKKVSTARPTARAADVQYASIQTRLASYSLDVVKSREGWEIDKSDNFQFLKKYGVVYGNADFGKKEWVCLATSECAESCDKQGWKMKIQMNDKNAWITSNCSRHLNMQHGVFTPGSEKREEKR